ncbi:hypothetical protein SSS_02831 [Sarcoptes scabiei]|uniref:Uncharacterized protein n=1 Tax=Sarcoptes scabiei TaxID=52283 RepID=A0A834VDX5_SARSC|nr:hypothetical protein SSS_02831 [Sarcoptes scabiei]
MALDVTSRSSLSNSSTEPLQSLINGPINSGSIEHLLHTYSNQIHQHRQQSQHQQQQPLKSMEDATLFLKAAAAAAAAAAAVSASENAASPSPTISSLPESSKSPTTTTSATKSTTPTLLINNNHSNSNNFSNHSPPSRSPSSSFDRQQSLDSDDNMGRPDSISPPQPLALTGRKQLINFNQNHDSRVKSPKNSSLSSAAQEISPLEKLQSLCPNTLMFQSMINNHHNNLAHHFNQLNHETNRALKFSIDNILSPEFGRSEAGRNLFYSYYQQFQERYSCYNLVKSSSSSSHHLQHHHHHCFIPRLIKQAIF